MDKLLKKLGYYYSIDLILGPYQKYFFPVLKKHAPDFNLSNADLGRIHLGSPSRSLMLRIMVTIYGNGKLYRAMCHHLPKRIAEVLEWLAWHGPITVAQLQTMLGRKVCTRSYSFQASDLPFEFRLFQIGSGSYYSTYFEQETVFLHPDLREALKSHLEKPAFFDLIPVEEPTPCMFTHEAEEILSQLSVFQTFAEQGQIQYHARGYKFKKVTYTRFAEIARFKEYYPKGCEYENLKKELMLRFIANVQSHEPAKAPWDHLRNLFNVYWTTNDFPHLQLMTHLRGISNHSVQVAENLTVSATMRYLLQHLPEQAWVSMENISDFIDYHSLPVTPLSDYYLDTIFLPTLMEVRGAWFDEKLFLRGAVTRSALVIPMVQANFFMMAAFGLVDIIYNHPVHDTWQYKQESWLSFYDGLAYVRLTPLGAYVCGREKHYEVTLSQPVEAEVTLDTRELIVHLSAEDPVKTMVLEKMAVPIARRRYRIGFGSFLEDCGNERDLERKINLFRSEICNNPGPNWEQFFEAVRRRIEPIREKRGWRLFSINEDPELIALLLRDPKLRSNIRKAEDFHILIKADAVTEVKKVLKKNGYII